MEEELKSIGIWLIEGALATVTLLISYIYVRDRKEQRDHNLGLEARVAHIEQNYVPRPEVNDIVDMVMDRVEGQHTSIIKEINITSDKMEVKFDKLQNLVIEIIKERRNKSRD